MLLGLAAGGRGWVKQVPGIEEEGGAGGGTAAALENMEQILKGNLRAHCSFHEGALCYCGSAVSSSTPRLGFRGSCLRGSVSAETKALHTPSIKRCLPSITCFLTPSCRLPQCLSGRDLLYGNMEHHCHVSLSANLNVVEHHLNNALIWIFSLNP